MDDVSASVSLKIIREEDRRKGYAVIHQVSVWDALLDTRIQLQKAVVATKNLPPPVSWPGGSAAQVESVLDEALHLSAELLQLQAGLFGLGSPGLDAHSNHDANDMGLLAATASQIEVNYEPVLIQTLSKWSSKIQAAVPNFSLQGKSSLGNSLGRTAGAVDAIQEILAASHGGSRLHLEQSTALADDWFGDTEFYQQLLHAVLGAGATAAGGGREAWKQRQIVTKRRRTVDTKASKGRKLRYQVHEKLQHFMTPIPALRGGWFDEQTDELFGSLVDTQ